MGHWVRVAADGDVAGGQIKGVAAAGKRLALCRVGDDFYAVDDRCTHDDGPLADGAVEDHQIECPRHGARFDLRTGEVKCLPAIIPIKSYPVKVEGHDVLVHVD